MTGSTRPIPSLSTSGSIAEIMKQQLLWMLLLRIIFYTLLAGIILIMSDKRFDIITIPANLLTLVILAVFLLTIGSAVYLIRLTGDHWEYRRFGFLQTLFDALFASVIVYFSGASYSIFTSVFFFPIIASGLLIPFKGGLIGAAASTILYATILILEFLGVLPDYLAQHELLEANDLYNSVNHFATKGLTFFLAAMISAMFGSRLKRTTEALTSTQHDFDRLSFLYKQIFDNITTGILTIDGSGIITSVNNATREITGLRIADMVGKPLASTFPEIDLRRDSPRNACDYKGPDHRKIRIGYAHAALKSGTGKGTVPETDTTIITLKDIGEIERLEAQMRQAEKLAAIGMMSAGIAHDFRNPLAAISGSAQLLAQEFSVQDAEPNHNYELTKIILRESDRLAKTITDFLKFARPDNIDRDWFLLRPCVEEIIQVCRADQKWPQSCVIVLHIDPLFRLWADEKQLFTVISHFISNAVAFCPPQRERIEIRADKRQGPDKALQRSISVYDNGIGIEPEQTKQIFEPFFTTRSNGTGLGLAIVRQIVEAHNGTIIVDRAENGGACFRVLLPDPEENDESGG